MLNMLKVLLFASLVACALGKFHSFLLLEIIMIVMGKFGVLKLWEKYQNF
jgi:hypothetical protein